MLNLLICVRSVIFVRTLFVRNKLKSCRFSSFELVIDNLDEIRQRYTTLTNHILDVHERIAGLETKVSLSISRCY